MRAFSALRRYWRYWLARAWHHGQRHLEFARVAYTWAHRDDGLGPSKAPAPWIAVGWIVSLVLALSTRGFVTSSSLDRRTSSVSALSSARISNYDLEQKFWGPISLRIFTISRAVACTSSRASRA